MSTSSFPLFPFSQGMEFLVYFPFSVLGRGFSYVWFGTLFREGHPLFVYPLFLETPLTSFRYLFVKEMSPIVLKEAKIATK